jgi:hypothetical protein
MDHQPVAQLAAIASDAAGAVAGDDEPTKRSFTSLKLRIE